MRLPSFEETLIYEVRSFYVPRPIYHGFLSNCSDGCCEYHVDVEYDWSISEWMTPSVLPWRKRKITPDEWKSRSHKSGGVWNWTYYTIGFQTHIIWECFVTLRYYIDAGYMVVCRLQPSSKCWTQKVSRILVTQHQNSQHLKFPWRSTLSIYWRAHIYEVSVRIRTKWLFENWVCTSS